jgi:hypothetical protein
MLQPVSNRPCRLAGPAAAGAALAILTGCGAGSVHHDSDDAGSPRAVATEFLQALEHQDGDGMRHLMTPMAQRNEEIPGGVLSSMPQLTSFRFSGRVAHESPRTNGSPRGSIASLRFTVAMTPSAGFSDDDTSGSAYGILVSETPDERWLVAEVGGGG